MVWAIKLPSEPHKYFSSINKRRKTTMNITRLEQETIVNFNAAEDTASVYTADPVYMRKLDKLCEREPASYKLVKQDKDGKWYEMPKRLVRFATSRIMTDEQKEAAAERMRKMQADGRI
nr:MAG TPA: Guanine nucleotide exchange factor synembryn [Caudoviricetes sp.]